VTAEAVAVAAGVLGDRARLGMPLGPLTTYRVGGPAAVGVVARNLDDLVAVAAAVAASGLDVLIVGRGSNLLVADAGFGGIAVALDAEGFGAFDVDEATGLVRAGAALPLPALAAWPRLPALGAALRSGGHRRRVPPPARRSPGGPGDHPRDRAVAARASTGWTERRLRVREPNGAA
jgi:hypothetical protein